MSNCHRAILGAVLVEPALAGLVCERLTDDDFDGWEQITFTAITELHTAGSTCDPLAVLSQLQATGRVRLIGAKVGPYLAELYEAATFPLEPERHIGDVLEHSYRRHIWDATTRIRQACAEFPLAAVRAAVDRELTGAMQAGSRLTPAKPVQPRPAGLTGLGAILSGFDESPAA